MDEWEAHHCNALGFSRYDEPLANLGLNCTLRPYILERADASSDTVTDRSDSIVSDSGDGIPGTRVGLSSFLNDTASSAAAAAADVTLLLNDSDDQGALLFRFTHSLFREVGRCRLTPG